jgi:hypothetical protein
MQSTPNELVAHFAYFFPVFFVTLWCFVSFLVSILGGWHSLSKHFRAHEEPYGYVRSVGPFSYGVKMRIGMNYGNVVRIVASDNGLYFSVLFLFRIGHPSLSIPWNEIQLRRTKIMWWRFVVLTLGNEEQIPMRISERMARNLGILERIQD